MAIVAANTTVRSVINLWEIEPGGLQTGIPRGEILFARRNTGVNPGVGDTSQYKMTGILPLNFAYVLVDCYAWARGNSSGTPWENVATVEVTEGIFAVDSKFSGEPNISIGLQGTPLASVNTATELFQGFVPTSPLPKVLLKAVKADQALNMTFRLRQLETAEMTASIYIRFLIYDISQANDHSMQSPILTR